MLKLFKKVYDKIGNSTLALSTFAIVSAMSMSANAQSLQNTGRQGITAGDAAENVNNSLSQIGELIIAAFFVGGIGLVGFGLFRLKKASDSQGRDATYGSAGLAIIIGAALAALPFVVGSGISTLFGSQGSNQTGGGFLN